MTQRIIAFLFCISLMGCDSATLQQVLNDVANGSGALTSAEIGQGLKQALEIGIKEGANRLSQENGYFNSPYKILLPPEARKVTEKLQGIPGFSQIEQNILEKINAGAEDAAKKAFPIFKEAITQMTFQDATNILMGDRNAATTYLQSATNQKLYNEFNPVIVESLDKFQARKVWSDAVTAYNKIPFIGEKVNPSLDDYVTQQALQGLFSMVEKKEAEIRTNVNARTSDLLKKVFAKQDN